MKDVRKLKDGNKVAGIVINIGLLVAIIGIVVLISAIVNRQEEKVAIIVTTGGHKAGTTTNVTMDMLLGKETNNSGYGIAYVSMSEYNRLNSMRNEMTDEPCYPVIKAEEVENLNGRFVSDYIPAGTTLRRDMFTSKNISTNPWLENIPIDENGNPYEVYEMVLDENDVYTGLLMPGTKVRIRAIAEINSEYADEVRSALVQKGLSEQDGISSIFQKYLALSSTKLTSTSLANTVPISEIIVDKIRIVDMENSDNESIFSVYMALMGMSYQSRMQLLGTSITDADSANEFRDRVKPTKLVFVLDKDDATALSELENLSGVKFKYTILVDNSEEEGSDIYSQINNISDSIYNFTESYGGLSLE